MNGYSFRAKVLLTICGILITLAILIGITIIGIKTNNKQQLEEREESMKLIELQLVEIDNANENYNLAINFILNHLPKLSEEKMEEIEVTLWNNFELEAKYNPLNIDSRAIGLSNVVGQLSNAIENNDLTLFLGAFETVTYINYINQFNSAEEKENGLEMVLERLSREGKFQNASYIEPSSMNKPVTIFLTYSDNVEIELSLDYVSNVDHHTHESGIEYLFTTPFEDLLKQID